MVAMCRGGVTETDGKKEQTRARVFFIEPSPSCPRGVFIDGDERSARIGIVHRGGEVFPASLARFPADAPSAVYAAAARTSAGPEGREP